MLLNNGCRSGLYIQSGSAALFHPRLTQFRTSSELACLGQTGSRVSAHLTFRYQRVNRDVAHSYQIPYQSYNIKIICLLTQVGSAPGL